MTNGDDTPALDTQYEFLPSAREGYRPTRTYGDRPHTGRTTMGVRLDVEGVPADGGGFEDASRDPSVDLRMYGPGDVTGIDERQVIRREPEPDTSTFAPNYFPLVEFDRADLPWLFSPERADADDGGKLRPWMALVVVERADEDVTVEADGTKPLPALTVPQDQLPPAEESWAWAHVQVVGQLSDQELSRALVEPSHQVISRLLCPRNLDPNTRYIAAVVPTFEPGRLAGLGKEPFPDGEDAQLQLAWGGSASGPVTLPVYHKWSFATGAKGDFESLARKLDPTRLDRHEVGVRDVDLTDPGPQPLHAPDGLTRQVGGALQSPGLETAAYPSVDADGTDEGKRLALRELLNDPDSYDGTRGGTAAETDDEPALPTVGPPIYGQWYLPEDADWGLSQTGVPEPPGLPRTAGTTGLAKYHGSWLHDLNCDPQYRLPASYGTEVVQENQEELMTAAWKMFGDLEQANEQLASSQAGDLVGRQLDRRLRSVDRSRFAQRVVDPEHLREQIAQAQQLQRSGALSGDLVVERVMGGGTTPTSGPAGGRIQRRGLSVDDSAPATTPTAARSRLGVDGRTRQPGGDLGAGVDDGFGGGAGDGFGGVDDGFGGGAGEGPTGVDVTGSGGLAGGETISEMPGRTGLATDSRLSSQLGGAAGAQMRSLAATDAELSQVGEAGLVPDGAGAMALAETALQTARMAEINSSSFRRLTRQGGRLAKGVDAGTEGSGVDIARQRRTEQFSFDSGPALGGRFGEDAARVAAEPEPEPSERAPGEPPRTDWRVDDAGTVLALAAAIDRLERPLVTVPKALMAVESVRDHCETAATALDELDDAARRGDAEAVLDSLTQRPTVGDRCRAIGQNTEDVLSRQLRKLVAADPEPLAPGFGEAERTEVLERFGTAQDALVAAVESAAALTREEEFDPAAVAEPVAEARAALSEVRESVDTVEDNVDDGIPPGAGRQGAGMQPMSAEFDGERPDEGEAVELDAAGFLSTRPAGSATLDITPTLRQADQQLATDISQGTATVPGVLDASGWSKQAAAWRLSPELLERDVELAPILAAPEFEQPMYRWLRDVDQTYLLPGADGVPKNSVGAVETNSKFIESFMCGCNHEMGRELLWRKYPTDRRGTYFRQFWEYTQDPELKDIRKQHTWQTNELGENRAPGISQNRVVLLVRGELLEAYPNTRIYAVKAVREDRTDSEDDRDWDRMPLLERKRQQAIEERKNDERKTLPDYDQDQLEQWAPKRPIFEGSLDPDITFLGFELTTEAAEGETLEETDDAGDYGWFFVVEEPVGETRFGLDVASDGDAGSVPYGVTHTADGERVTPTTTDDAEHGWQGLSWGHLVDDAATLSTKTHVSVGGDNPGGGDGEPWAVTAGERWNPDVDGFDPDEAATWGHNSAHMAAITWQLPVRICIHADDMLPDVSEDDGSDLTVTDRLAADARSDLLLGGGN